LLQCYASGGAVETTSSTVDEATTTTNDVSDAGQDATTLFVTSSDSATKASAAGDTPGTSASHTTNVNPPASQGTTQEDKVTTVGAGGTPITARREAGFTNGSRSPW